MIDQTLSLPERLLALEQKVENVLKIVGDLTAGGSSPGATTDLLAHVAHVLQKYFPHDIPDPAPTIPGTLGFSPFDNAPVIRQNSDGTDSDAAGMRWPRNKTRQTL